jgi:hypothetical protein
MPSMAYAGQPTPPALPTAPPPRVQSVAMEEIMPGSDPLRAIVVEILQGWGDLTQEDTNRLGVFRPDRVVATVNSAEMPRELKNNDQARARLAQLRRWVSGLERVAVRREETAVAPTPEYAAISGAQAAATAAVAAASLAPAPIPPAPVFPSFPSMPAAPGAPMAPPSGPAAPPLPAYPQAPPYPQAPAAPQPQAYPQAPAAPQAPFFAPQAPVGAQASAAEVSQAPTQPSDSRRIEMAEANRSTEAAIAAAAAAFWARPELGGTLPDAGAAAAPPQATPIAVPAPSTPQFPPLGQDLPTLAVETPAVLVPTVSTVPFEQAFPPIYRQEVASDDFLADLRGKISTAEALLALPIAEQTNMLVFLKPSELGKILQTTNDSGLKRAVIDTLESVGSPTALDIIYGCLDDPDPQIQSRALEAADRLLGAE